MKKLFSASITLISIAFMPACIGKCDSKPYKYDKAGEEAEIRQTFGRLLGASPTVACPDRVEIQDGKAAFICKVVHQDGSVQNYQIEVDNGSRSLRNAN